jgi:curved DNA-binding protein CbpA
MADPYLILSVAEDADDAAVEAAYRAGIKRFPPERDAERFQALRRAYERLRTRRDRLAYALFDTEPPSPQDILGRATSVDGADDAVGRPDAALLTALLRGEG